MKHQLQALVDLQLTDNRRARVIEDTGADSDALGRGYLGGALERKGALPRGVQVPSEVTD